MRSMRHLPLCIVLLAFPFATPAQESKNTEGPKQAPSTKEAKWEAVKQYMLKDDYPELFDDKPYRMKINNVIVDDVDNDGEDDVVVHVTPHYRQSPTILLFKVTKDLQVTRVVEGLAPGPLLPLGGEFLDSHAQGDGVDLTVGKNHHDRARRTAFIKSALKNKMNGVVEYANFVHMDGRSGRGSYVDMTALPKPPAANNCQDFEFSMPDSVTVMAKRDGSGNYLLALVGKQLYEYKITRIREDGFLDKTLVIHSVP